LVRLILDHLKTQSRAMPDAVSNPAILLTPGPAES
jgi:hypothetical protein